MCAQLKLGYSLHTDLSVRSNGDRSWDWTIPPPGLTKACARLYSQAPDYTLPLCSSSTQCLAPRAAMQCQRCKQAAASDRTPPAVSPAAFEQRVRCAEQMMGPPMGMPGGFPPGPGGFGGGRPQMPPRPRWNELPNADATGGPPCVALLPMRQLLLLPCLLSSCLKYSSCHVSPWSPRRQAFW